MAIKSNFKKKNITFSELSTYASKTLLKKNWKIKKLNYN
jgi:hypothetical protein